MKRLKGSSLYSGGATHDILNTKETKMTTQTILKMLEEIDDFMLDECINWVAGCIANIRRSPIPKRVFVRLRYWNTILQALEYVRKQKA